MRSPQAVSAGRQGGPAYGRSWPIAGRVFAAARVGRRPVAAYVGTDCVGPLRTVRRARRTVARALRSSAAGRRGEPSLANASSEPNVTRTILRTWGQAPATRTPAVVYHL